MHDHTAWCAIGAIVLTALVALIGPLPAAAALPADLAVEIQRAASNYHKRLRQALSRRGRGANPTLAATIERNDRRVAEAAMAAAVSRGITRNPALTEELVGAAVAAAPGLRPGLVQRLGIAYPGFRRRIQQASTAPPRPRAPPPAPVRNAPVRASLVRTALVRTALVRAAPVQMVAPAPAPVAASPARIVLRPPKLRHLRAAPAPKARAPVARGPVARLSAEPATRAEREPPPATVSRDDEVDNLDDAELDAAQLAASKALSGDPSLESGPTPAENDPLEGFNRVVFAINDTLDQYLLRPITWVYRLITPGLVRRSLGHAFRNLGAPVIFANDVLQAEAEDAGVTVSRFFINSTLGIAGLFDVATEFGLQYHPADFGETLNTYDIGAGPYLVLPLLGPGSVRHGTGRLVDGAMDPLIYVLDLPVRASLLVGGVLTKRDDVFTQLDSLRETSIDYYAAIRSLYYQDRADMLRRRSDGLAPAAAPPPALE